MRTFRPAQCKLSPPRDTFLSQGQLTTVASALLTRREAAEIGRVPLKAVDKAIEQGVVKPRRSAGKPLRTHAS